MAESSSRSLKGWALGLAALVAFGIGLWRAGNEDVVPGPETVEPTTTQARPAAPAPAAQGTRAAGAADHTITERGRLTLRASELPIEGPLKLALELTDEARGETPREVRIGAGDGREIRTLASIAPGPDSGLRLELDPGFLKPGHYLIEVKTDETSHMPLRRYALIVE